MFKSHSPSNKYNSGENTFIEHIEKSIKYLYVKFLKQTFFDVANYIQPEIPHKINKT